jgi:uncharacterized membrane protein
MPRAVIRLLSEGDRGFGPLQAWLGDALLAIAVWRFASIRLGITSGVGLGIAFVAYAQYLGRSRHRALLGLKSPAALQSETIWIEAHQLARWLFGLLGLVIAVAATTTLPWIWIALVGTATILVVVSGFAGWLRRRELRQDRAANSSLNR